MDGDDFIHSPFIEVQGLFLPVIAGSQTISTSTFESFYE